MAFEGRLFVIAAANYLTKTMLPADFPLAKEMEAMSDKLCVGGSAIIGPDARFIAGPVYDCETIVYGDIDLDRIPEEKLLLDVTGHYSRPDVFSFGVNRRRMDAITSFEA
mgnify:CR=1 FL=1